MKKTCAIFLLYVSLIACDSEPDIACQVHQVDVSDGQNNTTYRFVSGEAGNPRLTSVEVKGSNSSYVYNYSYAGDKLSFITKVTQGANPATTTYTAIFDGSTITKFSAPGEEVRLEYASGKITLSKGYTANVNKTFFQVAHTNYKYDANDNLVKSESYIDLAAVFSLAFGVDPTSYSPIMIGAAAYEFDGNVANPLQGHISLDNGDWAAMKSLPTKATYTDAAGKVQSTDTYTITKDGNKMPSEVRSGTKYLIFGFECQ